MEEKIIQAYIDNHRDLKEAKRYDENEDYKYCEGFEHALNFVLGLFGLEGEKVLRSSVKNKEKFGLTEERYEQMMEYYDYDEMEVQRVVADYGPDRCNKGYSIFYYGNTGLKDIEAIDSVGAFDDEEAVRRAVEDGIKIIPVEELPENMPEDLKLFIWLDCEGNRKCLERHFGKKKVQIERTVESCLEIAEEQEWNVGRCKNGSEVELQKYSPEGQDFIFTVDTEDDVDSFIYNIREFCENFDTSYEAYIWLDRTGHGTNGAPYDMKDVYEDMEACVQMAEELADILEKEMTKE